MIGLLMLAAVQQPTSMTGNDLYGFCQQTYVSGSYACLAYVLGARDMHNELVSRGAIRPSFCPGPEVTPSQQKDAVAAFLLRHPEKREQSAPSLVIEAMADSFPCPK